MRSHWALADTYPRYWVLAVVPYLLYAFAVNHTLETCQRIYAVRFLLTSLRPFAHTPPQIPVALAIWNQVAAECILLIRTYAFFNRNIYILILLVSALAGVVAYQLYVATSQMLRTSHSCVSIANTDDLHSLVLPFIPPNVRCLLYRTICVL